MEDRLEAPGAAGKLEASEPGFLTGGCICPSQVEHRLEVISREKGLVTHPSFEAKVV